MLAIGMMGSKQTSMEEEKKEEGLPGNETKHKLRLRQLRLAQNNITGEGLLALALAMRHNTHLVKLDLLKRSALAPQSLSQSRPEGSGPQARAIEQTTAVGTNTRGVLETHTVAHYGNSNVDGILPDTAAAYERDGGNNSSRDTIGITAGSATNSDNPGLENGHTEAGGAGIDQGDNRVGGGQTSTENASGNSDELVGDHSVTLAHLRRSDFLYGARFAVSFLHYDAAGTCSMASPNRSR